MIFCFLVESSAEISLSSMQSLSNDDEPKIFVKKKSYLPNRCPPPVKHLSRLLSLLSFHRTFLSSVASADATEFFFRI